RVRQEARWYEDAFNLPLREDSQISVLAFGRVFRVAEHEVVSARVCGVLDAFDDRREERVVDVWDEHPEREGPLQPEASRQCRRPVPQAPRGGDHALP